MNKCFPFSLSPVEPFDVHPAPDRVPTRPGRYIGERVHKTIIVGNFLKPFLRVLRLWTEAWDDP